jgi:DNA helicase II / ATP-dependent DNA helicase PcrA
MSTLHSNFERYHTHNGKVDQDQLDVIFNTSKRLVIEAPAGYGKTKTMVSKIAYLIESNQLPSAKKILSLTFSVNASYKIKSEIFNQIGLILERKTALSIINQRVKSSNYHGFGRHILALYGYLLNPNLGNIDHFKIIDESSQSDLKKLCMRENDKEFLASYAAALKAIGKPSEDSSKIAGYLKKNMDRYNYILLEKFIPNDFLTYNGILLCTLAIFNRFPQTAAFYQTYFPIIFVDEFQDTNWLQWKLLSALTDGRNFSKTDRHLYLFGDRLQRIYGFIGAVPNIFDIAKDIYQMELLKLNTNHRFLTDTKLGKIDRILRSNAESIRKPEIPFSIDLPILETTTQAEASAEVLGLINKILDEDSSATIAILVRTGLSNATTKEIYAALQNSQIKFFFALYKEDDQDYIDFHKKCSEIWMYGLQKRFLSFTAVKNYLNQEVAKFPKTEVNSSLTVILRLFLENVQNQFSFLSLEEKSGMVLETLSNRCLKQHLDLVTEARVILATVHGAKGLEWDYVIIPDLQKFCFPPAPFCIGICKNSKINWLKMTSEFEQAYLEELSVFYVAITRARKNIFFIFSNTIVFNSGNKQNSPLSCLAKLPGFTRLNEEA